MWWPHGVKDKMNLDSCTLTLTIGDLMGTAVSSPSSSAWVPERLCSFLILPPLRGLRVAENKACPSFLPPCSSKRPIRGKCSVHAYGMNEWKSLMGKSHTGVMCENLSNNLPLSFCEIKESLEEVNEVE